MTYTHQTDHSFSPEIEFWRPIENLFKNFPFWKGNDGLPEYKYPFEQLKEYYEMKTQDPFDIEKIKRDIYGDPINKKEWSIAEIRWEQLIKYLADCIENKGKVYKFQHFFECVYYFLREINEKNPKNEFVRTYRILKGRGIRYPPIEKLIHFEDYIEYFNSACRKYEVPFVMFTQNEECYVVHITDIFIEKVILDLPKFLSHPDLKKANSLFATAYKNKENGVYKDCLGKVREGMESIRDYIYTKFTLTSSGNLHNDMKELFNNHSNIVFDYSKIPESDPKKLKQITDYLRDSLLLAVKFGNFGHHILADPSLAEENTSLFSLGLVASIFPYLFYILK